MRPKVHMMAHVMLPGCISKVFLHLHIHDVIWCECVIGLLSPSETLDGPAIAYKSTMGPEHHRLGNLGG